MIYEVLGAGFHTNDAVAIITTDDFATTRVTAPVITVKNNDGSIQLYRLPLELEHWVLSCMRAASVEKTHFPVKLLSESSTLNFMWNLCKKEQMNLLLLVLQMS